MVCALEHTGKFMVIILTPCSTCVQPRMWPYDMVGILYHDCFHLYD